MTAVNPFLIERWTADPPSIGEHVDMLGRLLHACVHDGASVGFVLPFSCADAIAYWRRKVLPQVEEGSCRVLVARSAGRIVGTVQLDMATMPNQAHRADVKKLLVHPDSRRRGIARALMREVEDQARAAGRTLLTLDTRTGDFAEPLYSSLGYITAGVIPRYARRFDSDELDATTLMYKELSPIS